MGNIYKNQTKLRIILNVGDDLSAVNSQKIHFQKPNGVKGSWNAVADGANRSIYYDVQQDNEIDQVGTWKFWAELNYNDSRVAFGDPDSYRVFEQGVQKI